MKLYITMISLSLYCTSSIGVGYHHKKSSEKFTVNQNSDTKTPTDAYFEQKMRDDYDWGMLVTVISCDIQL